MASHRIDLRPFQILSSFDSATAKLRELQGYNSPIDLSAFVGQRSTSIELICSCPSPPPVSPSVPTTIQQASLRPDMEGDLEGDERLYFDDPEPRDGDEDIEFQAFDDRSVEEQDATTVCTATSNVQTLVLPANASFLEAHVFCSGLSVHKCTSDLRVSLLLDPDPPLSR